MQSSFANAKSWSCPCRPLCTRQLVSTGDVYLCRGELSAKFSSYMCVGYFLESIYETFNIQGYCVIVGCLNE